MYIEKKEEFDFWRFAKLSFVGFTFYGPHGLWFYWYCNPWYINKVIPKLLPAFTKHYSNWKKVFFSCFVDTVIYNIPYFTAAFFYVGLLSNKGSITKAFQDVKN